MKQAVDLDALAGLEEQRRFLLQSLRDLERERNAGDLDDDDYRTLKDDYTARAASVLRAIEDGHAGLVRHRRGRRRSTRVTALAVAGVLAVAVVAGVVVAASSGERIPGQTVTGNLPANTNDQLARAQQLLGEGKALDAVKLYDEVLKQEPDNTQALTFRGWILAAAGLHDEALASLDKAISANPGFSMSRFFKGMVLFQGKNDPAAAIPEFEAFLAANPPPDAAKTAQEVLSEAKQAAAAKP